MTVLEHRFAGMETELNEQPRPGEHTGDYRYRGTCACGHKEQWTADKDGAWEEIAAHLMPFIRQALAARQGSGEN
jgi:hypothetical protein